MKLEVRKSLLENMLANASTKYMKWNINHELSKVNRRIAEGNDAEYPTFIWAMDQNLSPNYQ
ncbi:MAG: hypothetical protein ACRCZ2_04125 [Fusobacteriaceae bacterium]